MSLRFAAPRTTMPRTHGPLSAIAEGARITLLKARIVFLLAPFQLLPWITEGRYDLEPKALCLPASDKPSQRTGRRARYSSQVEF